MNYLKIILQILFFIFPWPLRRLLLKNLFGFRFSKQSKIGYSLVLSDKVTMGEGAIISNLTFINTINCLTLSPYAKIGRKNWITGKPATKKNDNLLPIRRCELILGEHTRITDRHIIDCSGGVYIGSFSTIAGNHSQILTHSINYQTCKQEFSSVNIGDYCFVGTRCILLKASFIPSYCVVGAGAIVTGKLNDKYSLYAGNPAIFKKKLDPSCQYFLRESGHVS